MSTPNKLARPRLQGRGPIALVGVLAIIMGLAPAAPANQPASAAQGSRGSQGTRVFVEANDSWESSGGIVGNRDGLGGAMTGGARPQRTEVLKALQKLPECAGVSATLVREKADFTLVLEHDGGRMFFEKDNRIAIFNPDGDLIHTGARATLHAAVKDACQVIQKQARGSAAQGQ